MRTMTAKAEFAQSYIAHALMVLLVVAFVCSGDEVESVLVHVVFGRHLILQTPQMLVDESPWGCTRGS